jgi:hypothetical protein
MLRKALLALGIAAAVAMALPDAPQTSFSKSILALPAGAATAVPAPSVYGLTVTLKFTPDTIAGQASVAAAVQSFISSYISNLSINPQIKNVTTVLNTPSPSPTT